MNLLYCQHAANENLISECGMDSGLPANHEGTPSARAAIGRVTCLRAQGTSAFVCAPADKSAGRRHGSLASLPFGGSRNPLGQKK